MRKKSAGFYNAIERFGNKIPEPFSFFLILIVIVLVASFLLSLIGFSDINPATGEEVKVYNMLSKSGLVYILTSAVSNFTNFTVMCMTLSTMLGMAVAEKTGFFEILMRNIVLSAKGADKVVILIFCFVAVLADITNGPGCIIMPLLGGVVWSAMGRNPIAGLLCGYAGVMSAFSSNLMLSTTDITSTGFTQKAAEILDPNYVANASMGWFFQAVAVLPMVLATYFVTIKIVEPRLGPAKNRTTSIDNLEVTDAQKRGLKIAGIAELIYVLLVVVMTVPKSGWLRMEDGTLLNGKSPFFSALVFLLTLFFFIPGFTFGIATGKIKNIKDLVKMFNEGISSMSGFIVLCFIMSQFMAYFTKTNIGTLIAIKGANALTASGLPFVLICIIYIFFCGVMNLLMGSASAKYGVLAPVFVPMFMLMGYSPSVAQVAYRIGDAFTNPISPTFAYMAMLLAAVQKEDKEAGLGTVISNLMPYTIVSGIILIGMFAIWTALAIPYGPGEVLHYVLGG